MRNCLKNSGYGRSSRLMWNGGHDILWKHIADMYYEDLECGMQLLPKLTHAHIKLNSYSTMNIRLAAQVLSCSVSNIIKNMAHLVLQVLPSIVKWQIIFLTV